MSGVKHTPWKHEWIEESSDWAVFGCVYPPDAEGIAHQPGICTMSDSCDEDVARLIAAAPDLLEALESIVLMQEENHGDGVKTHLALSHLCVAARAAIARARGEQDGGAS